MIGVFDSGVGGLSVLKELRKQSPTVDIVYFGDTANMPYGSLPPVTLQHLTLEAFKLLRNQGAEMIVSACNSISTAVIRPMFDLFGIKDASVVEMVGPTRNFFQSYPQRDICIVATPATIASRVYQDEFYKSGIELKTIISESLASAVEKQWSESKIRKEIHSILMQVVAVNAKTLILGCTHYPLVRDLFEKEIEEMGLSISLFDPAREVARVALAQYTVQGTGKTIVLISKDSAIFRSIFLNEIPDAAILSTEKTVLNQKTSLC